MSFKSLVAKLMKEGKSRESATKIAGSVANAKMHGAGSGPTAAQSARSAATQREVTKGKDEFGNKVKTIRKRNVKKEITKVKKERAANFQPIEENPIITRKGKNRYVKTTTYASSARPLEENPVHNVKTKGIAPIQQTNNMKTNQSGGGESSTEAADQLKNLQSIARQDKMSEGKGKKYVKSKGEIKREKEFEEKELTGWNPREKPVKSDTTITKQSKSPTKQDDTFKVTTWNKYHNKKREKGKTTLTEGAKPITKHGEKTWSEGTQRSTNWATDDYPPKGEDWEGYQPPTRQGAIKKAITKIKKNKADKKASKEAYAAAKAKGNTYGGGGEGDLSIAKQVNSWEEEDVKRGREQEEKGHIGHAEALFDDAHGSYTWKDKFNAKSPVGQKMFGSEDFYKQNKTHDQAMELYSDSSKTMMDDTTGNKKWPVIPKFENYYPGSTEYKNVKTTLANKEEEKKKTAFSTRGMTEQRKSPTTQISKHMTK